jgi:hypothetical protein
MMRIVGTAGHIKVLLQSTLNFDLFRSTQELYMATQYDTQIQQLYVAYFNRPADAAGLAYWANVLATGGTEASISAAFSQSLEYQLAYNQTTNAGIVTQVYQNLFGRAPDAAGLAYWVQALTNRDITVANMVTTIAGGAQGTDEVAYNSKVVVAVAFTNALDLPAEQAGYSGADANTAAKELLSGIRTAAQATAAIVPATLDASVAAVIKAGVPFTLENGLAALGAADAAIVTFLADAEIDLDADGEIDEDVTEANIATNLADAITALEDNITDPAFDTATNAGVRAALIAEQVEINADALVDAQEELTELTAAVTAVRGLNNAIASFTSATDASDAADEAALVAVSNFDGGLTALNTRYADADFTVVVTGGVTTLTANVDLNGAAAGGVSNITVASIVEGEWEVAEVTGFNPASFTGLTALITSGNTVLATQADAEEAAEAELFAQLEVETRDITAAGTTALRDIDFTYITVAAGTSPTVANIRDELSALRSEGDDVTTFLGQVNGFLSTNLTVRATAVMDQQAVVDTAQDAVTDLQEAIANLATAQALTDELEALNEARDAAIADFEANDYNEPALVGVSNFGTTAADIFLANEVSGSITSFGRSGDDVLFIGSGYTLNTGAVTTGNNAVLEVFFTQQGNNTIVTIENEAFGSSSSAAADAKFTITLTGVDAADLTFNNGIISL